MLIFTRFNIVGSGWNDLFDAYKYLAGHEFTREEILKSVKELSESDLAGSFDAKVKPILESEDFLFVVTAMGDDWSFRVFSGSTREEVIQNLSQSL